MPSPRSRPRGDRDYDQPHHRGHLPDRRGAARLHRADRHLGNTKTRDYVIRREFDVSEGDPYNRVLIDRAERRLRNLGFFKTVHDHHRAGLGARQGHHQRGRRGAVDGRVLGRRRLSTPAASSPRCRWRRRTSSAAASSSRSRSAPARTSRTTTFPSPTPISSATASRRLRRQRRSRTRMASATGRSTRR